MRTWKDSGRRNKQFGARSSPRRENSLESLLLRIVDFSLFGIIFVAPLFYGGRDHLGHFVFICLTCIASSAWFFRQSILKAAVWHRTWANVLGTLAIVLVALQLLPLSSGLLSQLAPRNTTLLELWNTNSSTNASFDHWRTITVSPSSTKLALATLVSYMFLAITLIGRLRKLAEIERILKAIALAAVIMAAFGILQYFTANGLFYWVLKHPYSTTLDSAKGCFTCRNHFAHFLILGLGPLLYWIASNHSRGKDKQSQSGFSQPSWPDWEWIACHAGLGILVFAVLLSFSKGGILTLALASLFCLSLLYFKRLLSGAYIGSLLMFGILVLGGLSVSDYETISVRLNAFTTGSLDDLDNERGRRKIWAANVSAIQNGSLFGSGAGSHRDIYPVYLPESMNLEYTHAENGYLQIGSENGWLGIGLLCFGILLACSWCWLALSRAESNRSFALALAATSGILMSLVQSVYDFVWFIPSCMSVTIVLAISAYRIAQLERETDTSVGIELSPLNWKALAAAACITACWAILASLGPAAASLPMTRYQILAKETKKNSLEQIKNKESYEENQNERLATLEAMVFHLRNVIANDPNSAIGHLRLAGRLLELFNLRQLASENAMTVDQVRDAAFASKFQSSQALKDWMKQAFGSNAQLLYQSYYHAKKGVKLSPLQGSGYMYLAQLCFLESNDSQRIESYLSQGMLVRPFDGDTLFEAGRMKLLAGNFEESLNVWKTIFKDSGGHQYKIIRVLANQIPANLFLGFFEPDWDTLRAIWRDYSKKANREEMLSVLAYATQKAEESRETNRQHTTAHIFFSLSKMYEELGLAKQHLYYLQQAYQYSPGVYVFRRELGRELLKQQKHELACPHLKWCLARHPENTSLQEELMQATRRRLPQVSRGGDAPQHR